LAIDPLRLRKTLTFLLRHRPDVGRLRLDDDGWCTVDQVVEAVGRLQKIRIPSGELVAIAREDPYGSFQVDGSRIRAVRRIRVPDILYHATTVEVAEQARAAGLLTPSGQRFCRLHVREHLAWLAAHRQREGQPTVIYVDANRAFRSGIEFRRLDGGFFGVERLPVKFLLNLRECFGVQVSAGGFLVRKSASGADEVALVRVRRRSGVTWEVAKGKIEPGESPADTAIRELTEEMGLDVPLSVVADLGVSHYGFSTPAGEPRLKVLYLYVIRPLGEIHAFHPALKEGIEAVGFYDPDAAVRAVTHGSLGEPVRRLRRWLGVQARRTLPSSESGPPRSGAPPAA
jgi:putative RNA 2'-phosphotransferase